MPASYRRHDVTAKSLTPPDRQAYLLEKARLIARRAEQAEVDERLNAFFWQCFENDEEDEGDSED